MQDIADIVKRGNWQSAGGPEPGEDIVPQRRTLHELELHHPKIAQAVETVRAWQRRRRDDPRASLVLLGPVGTGRTHMALAALWSEFYHIGGQPLAPTGQFFKAADLLANLGSGTPVGTQVRGPIVVIDDVDTEQRIEYVAEHSQERERHVRFYRLIDWAYETYYVDQHGRRNSRPGVSLIITSNLPLAEFREYIGARAWDRLSQMAPRSDGTSYIRELFGVPSWRKRESGR